MTPFPFIDKAKEIHGGKYLYTERVHAYVPRECKYCTLNERGCCTKDRV